jgi:hypothetical protein
LWFRLITLTSAEGDKTANFKKENQEWDILGTLLRAYDLV